LIYAYSNLGNILEKQGNLEEPIILLKEAVRIKSHNVVIREHLARLYYKQGIYLNNQGKA
jgi:tetratricopeptide (TPR) repeat protein